MDSLDRSFYSVTKHVFFLVIYILIYILFLLLKKSGLGCHVGSTYAGAFGYANDIALIAPSLFSLKQMMRICENFAKSHNIIRQKRSCYVIIRIHKLSYRQYI